MNYNIDEFLYRTFMAPAIMNESKDYKFSNPDEGFLKGNLEAQTYIPYKNMTYLKPNLTNEKQRDMYNVQKYCFAAHELNLYLDVNPNDMKAVKLYNEYNKKANELTLEYERRYGPINLDDDISLSNWSWINNPWPWNKG